MKAEELNCLDAGAMVTANWEQGVQKKAAESTLALAELFEICAEMEIVRALQKLADQCAIVCDTEAVEFLSKGAILSSEQLKRLIPEESIQSTSLEAFQRGPCVVVLSIERDRLLKARCDVALTHHKRADIKVVSLFGGITPFLSAKILPDAQALCLGAASADPATHNFAIFSGGRTGSNVMADILSRNRVGAPKEHMRPPIYILHALTGSSFSLIKWFEVLRRLETRDGIFGTKVLPNHFLRLWPYLKTRERVFFREELSKARLIYNFRKDLVAQAISMFRADRMNIWEIKSDEGMQEYKTLAPPAYDFDRIARIYSSVEKYDAAIAQFLSSIPGDKLGIAYEEIEADRDEVFRRAADFIGVPGKISDVGTAHKKTADQHSQEMIERFRHDFTRRTGRAPERRA